MKKRKNFKNIFLIGAVIIFIIILFSLFILFALNAGIQNSFKGELRNLKKIISYAGVCTDSDNGLNYTFFGTATDSFGNTESDSCVDDYVLSEKFCLANNVSSENITCPNGCSYNKCIVKLNEAETRKNTIIFAGIYPSIPGQNAKSVTESYADKLSPYINGLATCCNVEGGDSSLIDIYHSKGYLVMTHIGSAEDAVKAARNKIDIIMFDEFKLRKVSLTGSQFNDIKNQIKAINPNAKVGLVELKIENYLSWYLEGANPDIVGLEQYITATGESLGRDITYDVYMNNIMTKFPYAKKQIWINDVSQINQFIGKADYIVLFGTDSYKLGVFGPDWPLFKLVDIIKRIKNVYGIYDIVSSFSPKSVYLGERFEIACNYEKILPCIIPIHGGDACNFLRFEGLSAIFSCIAKKTGLQDNYCSLFYYANDERCLNPRTDEIEKTNVVTTILYSSNAPSSADLGNSFEIACNYGENLPCITATHGEDACNFSRFEGLSAIFSCIAKKTGLQDNYCKMFYYDDKRCWYPADTKIQSTNIIGDCIGNCSGKQCGDDGCGDMCPMLCSGNTSKCNANGQCVECLNNTHCAYEYGCNAATGQCTEGIDTVSPVISSIFISVGSNSATIRWSTNESSNSLIDYGTSSVNLNNNRTDSNFVLTHSVLLLGLTGGTAYYYNITSCDGYGNCAVDGTYNLITSHSNNNINSESHIDSETKDYNILNWTDKESEAIITENGNKTEENTSLKKSDLASPEKFLTNNLWIIIILLIITIIMVCILIWMVKPKILKIKNRKFYCIFLMISCS